MDIALVIMAAGLGSRYNGVKQIDKMGPNGEILMEYSVYDAVKAGFNKIVLIIKDDIYDDVRELCGDRIAKMKTPSGEPVEVRYAFQSSDKYMDGYEIPPERVKPFGTIHAVICAKDQIHEPFAVINADDYYGIEAYRTIHDALAADSRDGKAYMVGYLLKNTVSKYGAVTRGVCSCENRKLRKVTETYKIKVFPDGTIRDTATDDEGIVLDPEAEVSMNMWGFDQSILETMTDYFADFLKNISVGDIKAECLLPVFVDDMLKKNALEVDMLRSNDSWFGITYQQDKPIVKSKLKMLHDAGSYPANLKD